MSKEGTRFIRKRDLTKKIHIDSTTGSLNSSSPTHEQSKESSAIQNYQHAMKALASLHEHLHELDLSNWEKETSEVLAFFLEGKKALLSIQQLQGYRESMALFGRYQQQLRKKGLELNEENASFTLGMLRRIVEDVNRLTQDEKYDNIVQETAIYKAVFMDLESFVVYLQSEASKV